MTLVATVLLSAIAATIALVLVRQTVLIARAETVRSDYDDAYQAALAVKLDFDQQLAQDPEFFYKRLFSYERPRLCTRSGETAAIIPPSSPSQVDNDDPNAPHDTPWPDACAEGNVWTYLGAGQIAIGAGVSGDSASYDPSAHPVRAEITPPSPGQPNLVLRVLAAKGETETGLTATYRPSSATAITAYSQADLRLDALYSQTDEVASRVDVRGTLYSGGQVYLPTTDSDFTGAQVLAEDGFIGTIPDTGRFYTTVQADPAVVDGTDGVRDLRAVVGDALSINGLRGSYSRLEAAGCPDGAATPTITTITGVRYQTSLCLRYGQPVGAGTFATTTGAANGARPAAYLLLFSGTKDAPTVKVYTAASKPATPGECLIQCDLGAVARPDYIAGKHPASPATTSSGLWRLLGEYPLPASGVLMTDADTYLGQCPGSIGGTSAPCDTTVAAGSVTVVAGSPHDPKDVALAGGLDTLPGTATKPGPHVGLVATRSIVVPYYARRPGGDLNVHANLAAFGYGLPRGQSALRAFPATQAPRSADPDNYGGTFTLTGSVAAPSLEAALPGWRRVTVVTDPLSVASPPPYFPGFAETWGTVGSDRLSSFDVCGQDNCSDSW